MKAKIFICTLALLGVIFPVFGNTLQIKPGQSIQAAIDKAESGDTLLIAKGLYQENEITIRKPLTLIGQDFPVIDGQNKGNIILVAAAQVNIVGLELINTGFSNMEDSAAIKFFDSDEATVENNRLNNTFFGIHFSNSKNMRIRGNQLRSTSEKEYQTGNGIHLWKCHHATIENNFVTGHRDGIYLEFVTNSTAIKNLIEDNKRYGLHFMFSHDNSYVENTFKKNGAGVSVMYTRNVLMKDNIFEDNWGPGSYGILLKDISNSEVTGNIFRKNTVGIYMEGSSRTTFKNNTFRENGWALKLMASCDDNTFVANNFIANTFDISTNGSLILNKLTENYWDKYEGYDLNKDQIGDILYRPINLYSVIVEKIPAAVMLWRSFLIGLLDRIEKAIPSITPENMVDNSPKLRPYDFGKQHL
ncbi:nitrous oxide reductase family maturation protein NosD [Rhodonellum sp.]|uniref:nitrous oxide reductase family maturation protein NosD n=1 Tax=Rhodonellum sp. TaxID=2231180 RepID=UPI002717E5CD|nr:nitrous oxide reductase family maturation protein NosD [Rhodonellum sp.]MDO9554467.1 nitrous oxide reductase family maturation protein NosD [Rhodonellum sp.]